MPTSQTLKQLQEAQEQAIDLFHRIGTSQILMPGRTEDEASAAIFELARGEFGVKQYWHKRIVRSGENTLLSFDHNPPDRRIATDDIVWVDLGPVFGQIEADFGRTYVLGDDPEKHRLRAAAEEAWQRCSELFRNDPGITGQGLYRAAIGLAEEFGYAFGNTMAGHLIDVFPHSKWHGSDPVQFICEENHVPMRAMRNGKMRYWILEIHFISRVERIGAFVEHLLIDAPGSDAFF